MMVNRDDAAASLMSIEQAERRTSQAIFYGIASRFFFLWGVVTAAGYGFAQAYPRSAGWAWPLLQCLGFALTLTMTARQGAVLTAEQRASAGGWSRRRSRWSDLPCCLSRCSGRSTDAS